MNNRRRVAIFLQNLDGGGAERAIVKLAGDIAKLDYAVELVLEDINTAYRSEIDPLVHVVNFSTRSSLSTFFKLVAYLRQKNPDVIMSALDTPNIMLLIAAKLARYSGRVVVSQRAVVSASLAHEPKLRAAITKILQWLLFDQADLVISNSYAASTEIHNLFAVPLEKIATIHNSIDVDKINRLAIEPINSNFFIKKDIPLIITVGSLTKRKDISTLVKAFSIVRSKMEVALVIIGKELVESKDSEKEALKRLIAELNLDSYIYLAGFDPNPYKWIGIASVFVSSSTAEGFPNVIAEALALGRPVVATDCPGDTARLLENGKWGRLVPVGDPASMATAIISSLEDLSHPDGRLRAANFAPSKIVEDYIGILFPDLK